MSRIPDLARDLVKTRARFHCERCRMPAPNGHWHHRRGRSVIDRHTHHPCNGVWLCEACHSWAHAHPSEAKKGGWIVSRFETEPGTIPVATPFGSRYHHCNGTFTFTIKEQP